MNHITRIVLLSVLIMSSVFADTLQLTVNQNSISLPFWPAREPHYGAVLIVRGGDRPQWSLLLAQFAKQLARNGWSVVLLNCKNSDPTPWITQLPEAISVLRQQNNKRIVLVHYGDQLNQSLEYFSKPQSKRVNGLVMLSAYDDQQNAEMPQSLRFPLFDIAGQFDYDTVLNQMELRAKEFKQRNYVAIQMPGAHHDYEYSQKLLLSFIHGWMTKLPEIKPQPRPILVSYIAPIYFDEHNHVLDSAVVSEREVVLESNIASIDESNWAGFIDNPQEP